jgi:hypothetical protein
MKTTIFLFSFFVFTTTSFCQSRLLFSIGTGDDDLREGSRINITVIFYNPERTAITREVAVGRRFPDRTTNNADIPLPDGITQTDIQEVRLEFVPSAGSFPQESDKWWFTRFVVTFMTPSSSVNLFENNSVNRKFEAQGTWSTGTLPLFSSVRTKRINVVDDDNRAVAEAEVFLRSATGGVWTPLGFTNSVGDVTTTATINATSQIITKKRVHEQNYYRSFHGLTAAQNWNYRVYLTNIDIDRNGLMVPNSTPLTANVVTLRVRKRNTLIGCNLVLSAEWDMNDADVATFQNTMGTASDYLYNATDGQFFFEQMTFVDRSAHWDDSDYRVFNSTSYRANVPNQTGAFLGQNVWGSAMKMARNDDGTVYAHEFGHYGLDVRDEYEDNSNMSCTGAVGDPSGTFVSGSPRSSCMMWNQGGAPKLCSTHPSNPHIRGTRQGDMSCWDKLKSRYNGANWQLVSPVDRNNIMGTLQLPSEVTFITPLIKTKFSIQTTNAATLVGNHLVSVVSSTNLPLPNTDIYTIAPVFVYHGRTNDAGQLNLTGMSVGDEIVAIHTSGVGASSQIVAGSSETLLLLNVDTRRGITANAPKPKPTQQQVFLANANIRFSYLNNEIIVGIKPNGKMKEMPEVQFITEGGVASFKLKPITLQQPSDTLFFRSMYYEGVTSGHLIVRGKYDTGENLVQIENVTTINAQAKDVSELFGDNGRIALHWGVEGKRSAAKLGIVIATTNDGATEIPATMKLIGKPFTVSTKDNALFSGSPQLEVRLPANRNGLYDKAINPKTLKMFSYDSTNKKWVEDTAFVYSFSAKMFAGNLKRNGMYAVFAAKN